MLRVALLLAAAGSHTAAGGDDRPLARFSDSEIHAELLARRRDAAAASPRVSATGANVSSAVEAAALRDAAWRHAVESSAARRPRASSSADGSATGWASGAAAAMPRVVIVTCVRCGARTQWLLIPHGDGQIVISRRVHTSNAASTEQRESHPPSPRARARRPQVRGSAARAAAAARVRGRGSGRAAAGVSHTTVTVQPLSDDILMRHVISVQATCCRRRRGRCTPRRRR